MRYDAPLKLTHADWNKQEPEEPYKRAVEEPDTVLGGDDDNRLGEDEEETE